MPPPPHHCPRVLDLLSHLHRISAINLHSVFSDCNLIIRSCMSWAAPQHDCVATRNIYTPAQDSV